MQTQSQVVAGKKPYLFETESRHLKQFYAKNMKQLLNRRIVFNNCIGTVRYAGQLHHQGKPAGCEGEKWVGLEWDDQGRGKHNGTVNGYKYFESQGKNGSLVKFQKIQFGYKLQTALFKRYFRAEELHHAKDIYESLKSYKQQLKDHTQEQKNEKCKQLIKKKIHKTEYDSEAYVQTLSKARKIMVEFIGFDEIWVKLNHLDKLQSISLPDCRICDLGPKNNLSGILKNLKLLSLEDNLISSWNQVFQLGLQLKNLKQLSLSNNRIQDLQVPVEQINAVQLPEHHQSYDIKQCKIFTNLQCIILINTGLTWKNFFKISAAFQHSIKQLILCKNDLSDIENILPEKVQKLKHLTFLNLEETKQTTFQGINKFKGLKNIQKLIVNRNQITHLGNVSGFDNLKHLSIQHCAISDPVVIYQISRFSQLQSLHIKHNPVGQILGNSHIRMRSIAEIVKLKVINGSMLQKYQRKDCQIYYLRESFKQYFSLKKVPDYDYDYLDFLKYCETHHPGIQYFIKKYGNPYEVESQKQIKQIVKDEVKQVQMKKGTGMIQVVIKNQQTSSVDPKKVPLTWTLNTLKNFFSKVYKIPVGVQSVTCQIEQSSAQQQMSQDHKTLGYYSLIAGSIINVYRKN